MTVRDDYLNEVRVMRAQNNDLWMKIVAIALDRAPDEVKPIMREIEAKDRAITAIWGVLAK